MTAGVASRTPEVSSGDVTSTAFAAEQHLGQSSVEVHRAESPSSPDLHVTGSALVINAGEPLATQPGASCSITVCADIPDSVSHAAVADTDNEVLSSCLVSSSQNTTA